MTGVADEAANAGVRSRHIFRALIRRTRAEVAPRLGGRAAISAVMRHPSYVGARWASAQVVTGRAWLILSALLRPAVLDLYDHPVLHSEAIGFPATPREYRATQKVLASMFAAFERISAPTASFADLCGVPADRRIIVSNGVDTRRVLPEPVPPEPVVGMSSGAAPGRGIELLIDAMSSVRSAVPDVRLELAMGVGPSDVRRRYVEHLRARVSGLEWVTIVEVPHPQLSSFLGRTTVLVVPHPPTPYMDVAAPLKVFDAMGASRPVVVTPRIETARVVRECGCGWVTRGDHVDDLAGAIVDAVSNPTLAQQMGRRGRICAESRYEWSVLSEQLADAVLAD